MPGPGSGTSIVREGWPALGGKMANLIRNHDWASSPLGPIDQWPQTLCTVVDLMLAALQPVYIAWGPTNTSLYNDGYIPILGIKHPRSLGQPYADVWSEVWEEYRPIIAATMTGEAQYFVDRPVPLIGRPGRPMSWFTFSWTPVRDETGIIAGFYCVATETTDRIRAEEVRLAHQLRQSEDALDASNARLRLALDVAELGTWSWDLTDGTGDIDARGAEIVGLDPGNLDDVGAAQVARTHPDDLSSMQAAAAAGIAAGAPFTLDYRTVHRDGSVHHVTSRARVVTDEAGHPIRLVGTNRDVTAEREAEAALRAARDESDRGRRLYETIAASTPDLIYVFDLKYRFTYANDALLAMWGRTWDDAIGKSLLEIGYEPWHAAMHEREIDQIIATRQPIRGEVSFPHATLGPRIYDYIFAPVLDAEGDVEAIAGTTRDITELRELSRQKDEFIGIVSHELRTPVTSIKAYAQILHRRFRQAGDARSAEMVAKMDTQLNRLTDLIGDLLDVTKIEAGQLRFHEEPFDLDPLVDEIIETLRPTADHHRILREGRTTSRVWGDRERTGQVLTNLLSNAVKYSPNADSVLVHTADDISNVTIAVQDFGIGIAATDVPHVFDRFYRADGPTQDTFAGIGLGLYISAEIVRRQGGKIWVESEPGTGSTFSFTVPLHSSESA